MEKDNSLFKKLKGFQKADRGRFFLLSLGKLTQEEFVLYELCVAITDWDRCHLDTYGTFKATNQELAEVLGRDAGSTISRHKKSLMEKGFLDAQGERLRVKDFENWELRKKGA